jgi:hypothetical protein
MGTLFEALQNTEYRRLYARYLVIKNQPISERLIHEFDLKMISLIEKEMRGYEKRRK